MALFHVNFYSDVLGMCMNMDVIIPEASQGIGVESKRTDGKFPTLYLLHGMSDDHTIWQRRTSIERYATEKGVAVVMPTTHLAWYTDTQYGQRYWKFIAEELPAKCRSFFAGMSDKREDTFAAGLSMGGYGAMKLGLGASDTFAAVASLSGGLDAVECASGHEGSDRDLWRGIFGKPRKIKGSENDLFHLAELLVKSGKPLPKIYMWCGTEDFLYLQNRRMKNHLERLGYDLTYEESPGDHQWKYWDEKIQTVLEWLPL